MKFFSFSRTSFKKNALLRTVFSWFYSRIMIKLSALAPGRLPKTILSHKFTLNYFPGPKSLAFQSNSVVGSALKRRKNSVSLMHNIKWTWTLNLRELRNRKEIGHKHFGVLSSRKKGCYAWANIFWGLRVIFNFLARYQLCEKNRRNRLSLNNSRWWIMIITSRRTNINYEINF